MTEDLHEGGEAVMRTVMCAGKEFDLKGDDATKLREAIEQYQSVTVSAHASVGTPRDPRTGKAIDPKAGKRVGGA